ncbi:MAG: DNA repair protein rad50 [Alyxoria varia]|nr:MAG: DNA repair protein rad50 [Alyxoria varia]
MAIRAFDPSEPQYLDILTPLTLIVGTNGSGKTTVIECLKYATTGYLPPNSKGGAFIHDPRLSGEKEVLAQVRLLFFSTSSVRMVATRRVQLTVKKTKREFKTLDCSLRIRNDKKETATMSSRVAELDQILPQYLGVSKSVLDNVIFCHQEESMWPLSEPSNLKKKFDEIFEASKYTKAIDNLKVARKQQVEALGALRANEKHAKDDKDRGKGTKRKIDALYDEWTDLNSKMKELEDQRQHAHEKAKEAFNHASRFTDIVSQLENKRLEANIKNENIRELEQHMTRMNDSDDVLRSMLETFEERVSDYDGQLQIKTQSYHDLSKGIEDNRRTLRSKESEYGRYQAEKDHYEKQIQNRENLVKEAAHRHNIRGYDWELDEKAVRGFMERLNKMSRDQNAAVDRVRREAQEESEQTQTELNSLREKKSALRQNKDNCKTQISSNDKKLADYRRRINEIEVDESSRARFERSISETEENLNASKNNFESKGWDDLIKKAEADIQAHESDSGQLHQELIDASNQSKESAKRDLYHSKVKAAQQELDTLEGTHGARISELIGPNWKPAELEAAYANVLKKKSEDIKEAEQLRDGINRELEQHIYQSSSAQNDLKKKRKDREEHNRTIQNQLDECLPDEYEETLNAIETSVQNIKRDLNMYKKLDEYYGQCRELLESEDRCKLCQRKYGGPTDTEEDKKEHARNRQFLREKLDKMLSGSKKNELERELKDNEEDLRKAHAVRSNYDSWKKLGEKEIPDLDKEVKRLQPRREELNRKAEQQDNVLRERENAKVEVESLQKAVQKIGRCCVDISSNQASLSSLQTKQSQAGITRGFEEINREMEGVNEKTKSAKNHLSQLTHERDRAKAQIHQLNMDLKDLQSDLTNANHQLKERDDVKAQMDDLTTSSEEYRKKTKTVDQETEDLQPRISHSEEKLRDIQERGETKERHLKDDASKLSNSVNQLQLADRDINAYVDKNGPAQLLRCEKEMKNIEEELNNLQNQQKSLTGEIKKIEEEKKNKSETRRHIVDNLRHRENLQALQEVQNEIQRLESFDAERDRDKYTKEGEHHHSRHLKLNMEHSSLGGELKSRDNELQRLKKDYDTLYKDADARYMDAHIKVVVNEGGVEDITRYIGALDQAIMKYHSLKMEEINRIMEELWRTTYQGTDVDTILIRSETEGAKGAIKHNYRVCMVKQDAEMDMRGRCSAGQKVLASIIIRLALAECFGVNCGLIALDEPTTNLDRENITALARSLHGLIKMRRKQANFQLIVITHDEDFLREMDVFDFAENYYRISRDEKQKSKIDVQSTLDLKD